MYRIVRLGIVIMTTAVAISSAAVWAQGPNEQDGRASGNRPPQIDQDRREMSDQAVLDRLTESLGLSDDQKSNVKDILAKSRPEVEQLKKEMKSLQERIKKSVAGVQSSISETLNTEQAEKFKGSAGRLLTQRVSGGMTGGLGMRGNGPEGAMREGRRQPPDMRGQGGDFRREGPPPGTDAPGEAQ
jgi:hypothetical protein